jgi:gluconolactonase
MHSNRRHFLMAAAGGIAAASVRAQSQAPISPVPTARTWAAGETVQYPDPDIIALDRRFGRYIINNTSMKRLYTGTLWSEGPAWNGVGKYMVWSDIPNNVQMRWIEDDNRVTVFRNPSGFSNGNTFDFEGRQLSCEHGGRRVVRYEPSGAITVIAEKFQGKRFNSPNDIVVHPDGGIWFTDPAYGINGNYEGYKADSEMKEAVYRADPKTGQIEKVTDEPGGPNGVCFSPDYKKFYIADTGGPRQIWTYDLDGKAIRNGKRFIQLDVPGTGAPSAADGIRCDVDGNIWAGARPGVQIITPNAERIGMIRLPETCANICFGGRARNRLFMAASQSLYSVYVNTQGAHIA